MILDHPDGLAVHPPLLGERHPTYTWPRGIDDHPGAAHRGSARDRHPFGSLCAAQPP